MQQPQMPKTETTPAPVTQPAKTKKMAQAKSARKQAPVAPIKEQPMMQQPQ